MTNPDTPVGILWQRSNLDRLGGLGPTEADTRIVFNTLNGIFYAHRFSGVHRLVNAVL